MAAADDVITGFARDGFGLVKAGAEVLERRGCALLLADDQIQRAALRKVLAGIVKHPVDDRLARADGRVGHDHVKDAGDTCKTVALHHLARKAVEREIFAAQRQRAFVDVAQGEGKRRVARGDQDAQRAPAAAHVQRAAAKAVRHALREHNRARIQMLAGENARVGFKGKRLAGKGRGKTANVVRALRRCGVIMLGHRCLHPAESRLIYTQPSADTA